MTTAASGKPGNIAREREPPLVSNAPAIPVNGQAAGGSRSTHRAGTQAGRERVRVRQDLPGHRAVNGA